MHYGGDFGLFVPPEGETGLSLVFVQSRDGNTEAADPSALGGGATDRHLIYEGLSRVAADAVLAGARSVYPEAFFSVWHPELVALRESLGLPRHPAQVVVSKQGRLDFGALLFNVPDVPVFLLAGDECTSCHEAALCARPWIRQVPFHGVLRPVIDRLRVEEGIRRISAIGGRFTATRLVDEELAQDIYLTTTPHEGGQSGTPWYSGTSSPRLRVITKKQWFDSRSSIVFEHVLIPGRRPDSTSSVA
jgi:riboflavin biosynthesis pyrimidine reductase